MRRSVARSGREREVAVALLPARDLVARDRLHLHVEREQVVAALDRVLGLDLLDEELAVEPLSEQPALHVGEGDDDRVDRRRSATSAFSSSKLSTSAILCRPLTEVPW